jgi:hypothetical protein
MLLLIIILVYITVCYVNLKGLFRLGSRKDIIVYGVLMILAFIISIAAVLGVEFPYVSSLILHMSIGEGRLR